MEQVIILSKDESKIAMDGLVSRGLAKRRGESDWLTTQGGQIKASELWNKLPLDEKLLMILSLRGLITTEFWTL